MTKESEIPRPSRPSSPTTHQIPCSGITADPRWLRNLYDSLGCQDLPVTDPRQMVSHRLSSDQECERLMPWLTVAMEEHNRRYNR